MTSIANGTKAKDALIESKEYKDARVNGGVKPKDEATKAEGSISPSQKVTLGKVTDILGLLVSGSGMATPLLTALDDAKQIIENYVARFENGAGPDPNIGQAADDSEVHCTPDPYRGSMDVEVDVDALTQASPQPDDGPPAKLQRT